MALKELNDTGGMHEVRALPHKREFDRTWHQIPRAERALIEREINRRLDELSNSPDARWGSITNTSIEGGRVNELTGKPGDWTGTVFDPIYIACGSHEERAGKFFGNVWKSVIISRAETWIGIRFDPTFPNRGITLGGKTYFVDYSASKES
ncbi:hypothetical protein [Candidatus Korobacter versatilis]|nr:hypothetical protein [Candidatus Koribacter versatilis]